MEIAYEHFWCPLVSFLTHLRFTKSTERFASCNSHFCHIHVQNWLLFITRKTTRCTRQRRPCAAVPHSLSQDGGDIYILYPENISDHVMCVHRFRESFTAVRLSVGQWNLMAHIYIHGIPLSYLLRWHQSVGIRGCLWKGVIERSYSL